MKRKILETTHRVNDVPKQLLTVNARHRRNSPCTGNNTLVHLNIWSMCEFSGVKCLLHHQCSQQKILLFLIFPCFFSWYNQQIHLNSTSKNLPCIFFGSPRPESRWQRPGSRWASLPSVKWSPEETPTGLKHSKSVQTFLPIVSSRNSGKLQFF